MAENCHLFFVKKKDETSKSGKDMPFLSLCLSQFFVLKISNLYKNCF